MECTIEIYRLDREGGLSITRTSSIGGSLRGESLLREGVEDDEEEGNGEGDEVDGDESMEGGGRGGVILNGGRIIFDGRRRVRSSREAVRAPNESLKENDVKEEMQIIKLTFIFINSLFISSTLSSASHNLSNLLFLSVISAVISTNRLSI